MADQARKPQESAEDERVDVLVGEVVETARRRSPATPFRLDLQPTIVTAVPGGAARSPAAGVALVDRDGDRTTV